MPGASGGREIQAEARARPPNQQPATHEQQPIADAGRNASHASNLGGGRRVAGRGPDVGGSPQAEDQGGEGGRGR